MPQELSICMQPETIPTTSSGKVCQCLVEIDMLWNGWEFSFYVHYMLHDVHIHLCLCVVIVCCFVPHRWTAPVFLTFWSTRSCVALSASPVETPSLRCSTALSPPLWMPSQVPLEVGLCLSECLCDLSLWLGHSLSPASDYTMYPFSTQNPKDFQNLLSVYLDAVFFPCLRELDFW